MEKDFLGKTALITGASIGIGLATAELFAKRGANTVLVDIDEEKLNAAAEKVRSYGAETLAFVCDVSDEVRVRAVCAEALAHFGKIEILVNNAGIWRRWMPFLETTSDMWKQYIGVNMLGTMYFTHALLGGMVENGFGRVINVASVAGVYGNASMADYSMTKAGVIAFTSAIAKEVATKGVTANCVSPGSVSSHQDTIEPSDLNHMGRTGNHTENAEMICFLASDGASYISGQNIQVDGCRRRI